MSKHGKRHVETRTASSGDAGGGASPDEETAASSSDGDEETPSSSGDVGGAPEAKLLADESAFRALTGAPELALHPEGAVLLLGYLRERAHAFPDDKEAAYPKDVIAFARALRRDKPMVWSALAVCDYIRLAAALRLCGMPVVTGLALQRACAELGRNGRGA